MSKFRFRHSKRIKPRREREVPLRCIVPNMVTALAACCGITSITLSVEGRWTHALIALLVACVCDGMDGRVARALNASSKLGAELDSLADFVNFGVAPGLFLYYWLIPTLDGTLLSARLLLALALFYAMADAFRLARFNTMLEMPTQPYWKHFFLGVPAPGGAWMVLSPVLLWVGMGQPENNFIRNPYLGAFMLLFVGTLMASRFPTPSAKCIRVSKPYLLPIMTLVIGVICLAVVRFWLTLGVLGMIYILSIPVCAMIFTRIKAKFERNRSQADV